MKSVFLILIGLFSVNAFASCPAEATGYDCQVVKVLTRCDVEKAALRRKIYALEKKVKELEAKQVVQAKTVYIYKEKVVEKHVVETKVKHSILSLYTTRDVISSGSYQQGNTTTAVVHTGYEPGIKYQYQFNFGLVPEVGVNLKGNPLFGLGFEF